MSLYPATRIHRGGLAKAQEYREELAEVFPRLFPRLLSELARLLRRCPEAEELLTDAILRACLLTSPRDPRFSGVCVHGLRQNLQLRRVTARQEERNLKRARRLGLVEAVDGGNDPETQGTPEQGAVASYYPYRAEEEELGEASERVRMRELLSGLGAEERKTLDYLRADREEREEIGRSLGQKPGVLRQRAYRLKLKLRTKLEESRAQDRP